MILMHVIAWTVFFSLPNLLRPDFQREGSHIVRQPFFTAENLVTHSFLVILFYLHAYYLIPRFLNRKKIPRYALSLLIIFSAAFLVTYAARKIQEQRIYDTVRNLPPQQGNLAIRPFHRMHSLMFRMPILFSLFAVVFVLAVSMAYRFVLDKLRQESLQQLRQNEHLKTELGFLRSQISPHFIFNILNSAVSLARLGSDQLEPMLIKLSNLLRYMLYNADDDKVPLSQEVEYLESYIDLQKIRFEEDVEIQFTRSGMFLGHGIEPMLLIPFVENAFKHGIGRIDKPAIFIDMKEANGILNFQVRNRFNPALHPTQDKHSGIGLANVRKRLQLLYDDKYSLDVQAGNEWFDIKLNLVLK